MSEHQFRANFCPSLKKIVQPKFKKFVIFFTKSNWLKFLRFFLKGLMSIIFNNFILSIIGRPSCVKKCAKYRFKIHAIIVGFLQSQSIVQISMLLRDESLSMNVIFKYSNEKSFINSETELNLKFFVFVSRTFLYSLHMLYVYLLFFLHLNHFFIAFHSHSFVLFLILSFIFFFFFLHLEPNSSFSHEPKIELSNK